MTVSTIDQEFETIHGEDMRALMPTFYSYQKLDDVKAYICQNFNISRDQLHDILHNDKMISDDVRISGYSIKGLLHGKEKEFFGPVILRMNNGYIIFCFMIANQMVGNVYTFLQGDFVNAFYVNSNIHYEEL